MHTATSIKTATYQLSLVKGDEQYLIRCRPGDEVATIAHLMEWADDPELGFDWFDAAVLSRQIAQRVMGRAVGEPAEP
jgi:hypothetical protein